MTLNVTDAQGKHPYLFQHSLMVGNGDALSISIVGDFKISSTKVILPNGLIVPTIKKNFLSILQFTKDFNNCFFLFYP